MKKIISTFVAVCMILTLFSTFVTADHTEFNINSVTYDSQGAYFTLTVNGTCEVGNNVSIRVKNKNGTVKALKQFKVADSESFSYTVKVNSSGDETLYETDGSLVYTVYVRNSDNQSATYSVPLYTEASKLEIVSKKFNGATDTSTMVGYIETYSKVFGFDLKYFDSMKSSVADFLIKNKNITPLTLENIAGVYNDSVIRAYLFNEDKSADRTEIIEYPEYAAMLKFKEGFDGAKSLYGDYDALESEAKTKVNEIVFTEENSMKDFSKLKEKFFMAITETVFAVNDDDSEKVYGFLKEHNDWFKLEKLEDLLTYDAYQIISEMSDRDIPDNKVDFADLYDEIYAEVCKKEPVKKPTSGGGGGGFAGNVIGGETGYEKPEPPVEIKPIEPVTFNDLDGHSWAKEAIEALAAKGIINGRGDGIFAPAENITREEFAKILVLTYDMYEENAKCSFSDVSKERWSYNYIAVMYENGIITGYPDGTFKPENNVTREEMAVMLCRVLMRLNKINEEYETSSSYKDYGEISDFAQNSVRTLSNNHILSGDDRGCFNPKKGATRAEVCKMIYNTGL